MARHKLYANPDGEGYILDVQSNILEDMETRVVVPLLPVSQTSSTTRLNPVFVVRGEKHAMITQAMAAVPENLLKTPVTDFSDHVDEINKALDMLLYGF